jgi:hypothetical protein
MNYQLLLNCNKVHRAHLEQEIELTCLLRAIGVCTLDLKAIVQINKMIPCILHLEIRVGIKMFSMMVSRGLSAHAFEYAMHACPALTTVLHCILPITPSPHTYIQAKLFPSIAANHHHLHHSLHYITLQYITLHCITVVVRRTKQRRTTSLHQVPYQYSSTTCRRNAQYSAVPHSSRIGSDKLHHSSAAHDDRV